MDFFDYYFTENNDVIEEDIYEIDLNDLTGTQLNVLLEVHKRYLMNKTDPGRVKRARQDIKTHRRNIRVSEDKEGNEVIEFNFRANPSREFRNHMGYVIHKGNDIRQLYCDCRDYFYRIYYPLVKAGLATWDIPKKYKKRMEKFIKPHNHEPTLKTNPSGKLFVCKHLYALLLEFVGKDIKARPLRGVRISPDVKKRIAADRAKEKAARQAQKPNMGDKKIDNKHIGTDTALDKDKIDSEIEARKAKEAEAKAKEDELKAKEAEEEKLKKIETKKAEEEEKKKAEEEKKK